MVDLLFMHSFFRSSRSFRRSFFHFYLQTLLYTLPTDNFHQKRYPRTILPRHPLSHSVSWPAERHGMLVFSHIA